jgi:hypothetical protein
MGSQEDLSHPHHLIYLPMQKAWFSLWHIIGYDGRVVLPMKVLNLIATCIAVLAFGMMLRFFIRGLILFSAVVSGFAFAYVTWHFASQGEPVPFFLLFSVLSLYLMVRLLVGGGPGWGTAIVLGLVNTAGVLLHQELVLMLPFSACVLWLRSGGEIRGRMLALYLVITVLGVGIPYIAIGSCLAGATSVSELVKWTSGYLRLFEGTGCGRWSNLNVTNIATGVTRAFLGGDALKAYLLGGAARGYRFYVALVPPVGVMLFIGIGMVTLLARLRLVLVRTKSHIVLFVAVAVVFGVAVAWWSPQNRAFWSPVVPCILLLAGMGYASIPSQRSLVVARNTLCVVFTVLLIWGNLTGGILAKHTHQDEEEKILVELEERVRPSDVVILACGRHICLVDYYAPHIHTLEVLTGPRGESPVFRDLREEAVYEAGATLIKGHRVFMSSEVLGPGEGPGAFLSLPAGMEINARPAFNYVDSFSGVIQYQILEINLHSSPPVF